jgi:hypothetical protein
VEGGRDGSQKLPIEEQALKLLKDGLSDKQVATKVGTNPNHVWAIRVASGLRPVTPTQLKIAKAVVERKRKTAAR